MLVSFLSRIKHKNLLKLFFEHNKKGTASYIIF